MKLKIFFTVITLILLPIYLKAAYVVPPPPPEPPHMDAQDENGNTALIRAAKPKTRNPDEIISLLKAGANPWIFNKKNKNFFDYLDEDFLKQHPDIQKMIKSIQEKREKELEQMQEEMRSSFEHFGSIFHCGPGTKQVDC